MSRHDEVLALIQAGGSGGRMDVLTRERAKPALPYGGVHRLIDFALTGMVHAGVRDVWVSLEYQVASIDEYLSGGRPWDLDSSRGGFRRMVPQTGLGPRHRGQVRPRQRRPAAPAGAGHRGARGADAAGVERRPRLRRRPRARHRASTATPGATATVLTAEVTKREAAQNVTVLTGRGGRVTAVEEKPSRPTTGTVATEIFVYETAPLLETLRTLRAELSAGCGRGRQRDRGLRREPAAAARRGRQVRAVPLDGYWRDLGRPGAYLQGHRDLLARQGRDPPPGPTDPQQVGGPTGGADPHRSRHRGEPGLARVRRGGHRDRQRARPRGGGRSRRARGGQRAVRGRRGPPRRPGHDERPGRRVRGGPRSRRRVGAPRQGRPRRRPGARGPGQPGRTRRAWCPAGARLEPGTTV